MDQQILYLITNVHIISSLEKFDQSPPPPPHKNSPRLDTCTIHRNIGWYPDLQGNRTQHLSVVHIVVEINDIFSLIWRCYGPKQDILDYWGTLIFCLWSYYILSKDKGL